MLKRVLFITLSWLGISQSVLLAQTVDPKIQKLGNQVIVNVYQTIESKKNFYKELADFSQKNLLEDQQGFYLLKYESYGLGDLSTVKSFGFVVQLVPIHKALKISERAFRFDYPLLGVSLIGEQFLALKSKQLDVRSIVEEFQQVLADEQQKKMPFKLSINTSKDAFKENEDIEFVVSLKNVTDHNLKIKSLSSKSLRFTIDNEIWGTNEAEGAGKGRTEYAVLKSGEVMSRTFKGKGLSRFKEFRIHCVYNMSYQGVNPEAILKVKILKPLPEMSL